MPKSNPRSKAKVKQSKPFRRKVDLDVSPQNGKAARKVIAKMGDFTFPDEVNISNAMSRKRFVQRLAEAVMCPVEELSHVAQKLVKAAEEADQKAVADEHAKQAELEKQLADALKSAQQSSESILDQTPADILAEAKAFLADPNIFDRLAQDLETLGIVGEKTLAKMTYVIGTSRLLDDPIAGCVKAASSSGKSHVTRGVVSCFPPEHVLAATDITPAALYYVPNGFLRHKFITVAERQHVAGNDQGADPRE